jgi:hypothetical protein
LGPDALDFCGVRIFSSDADHRAISQKGRPAFEQVSHLESKLRYTIDQPGCYSS